MTSALTLLMLVFMGDAATSGPAAPDVTSWVHVVGRVEGIEGDRVTVRGQDGGTVAVHVGSLALEIVDVLRPGRDVVLYGPRQADGTVIARGLALDYGDAPAASPALP